MLEIDNKLLKIGTRILKGPAVDPLNPYNLPPFTLRLKFRDTYDPTSRSGSWRQVSSTPNIWDWTNENSNWFQSFYEEQYLIEVLGGNTIGVTNMERTFSNCYNLATVNIFDTHNVTSTGNIFGGMFSGCSSLTTVPLFDMSNNESMMSMFSDCHSLTSIPFFNTSKVKSMARAFLHCYLITTIPAFDTSNVTDMASMFNDCKALISIPQLNTSSLVSMEGMFVACSNLTTVPLFDTSKVSDFKQVFSGCSSLTTVPLFDTSKASTFENMFRNCTSLTNIPLFDTTLVLNMEKTFSGCKSVQSGALALYQQASTQSFPPVNHSGTFTNCGSNTTTGAAELAQIPSDWK